MRLIAVLVPAVVVAAGCVHGVALTQQDIDQYGGATFNAQPEKAFAAAQGALKSMGYEIAFADASTGTIKTGRKMIRAVGSANQATGVYRQYTLILRSDSKEGTRITAVPRVFIGESDVSDGEVWAMEGPQGEKRLWSDLFRELSEILGPARPSAEHANSQI
jgi:hypothetical protein